MSDTISQVIANFLNDKSLRYRYDIRTVKRLLGKPGVNSNIQHREYALRSQDILQRLWSEEITKPHVREALAVAIKESVLSYTRDKRTAVAIYKDLVGFIKEAYHVEIPVAFPPTFASEFDRQMYIVKALHRKGRGVASLRDELWVSERTIENDLEKLRGSGVSIMNQKITIEGIERERGVIEFGSTVHPLFLALNLTQVIVILQGLQHMAKEDGYRNYALKLATTVWHELSDYAKERIEQLTGPLSLDPTWHAEIKSCGDRVLFNTEEECSADEGGANVVYFLKNRKQCLIEYWDDRGTVVRLANCLIQDYSRRTNEIVVCANDEKHILNMDSLIRVIANQ